MAYQLAVANKRKGFSPVKRCAGPWWLKGFLKLWPCLKKKNAKNLSLYYVACANSFQVAKFFRLYKKLLDDFSLVYKPFNIWNIDETGIPDIPKEQRVIGVKGEQCSQTVPAEKPANTTLLTFVSAGGMVMPPMLIFKGSKVDQDARDAAPSGWLMRHSKSGYVNSKLFAEMGEKLVAFIRDKKLDSNGKHLLLLDSHSTHSFNLHFMRYLRGHGVEVMCFPPHCTHLMQPLDDVPFALLKKNYQQEILDYNFRNSGKKLSKVNFFRVLVPAFTRAMSEKNIRSGFEHTRMYPVNPLAPKLLRTWPSLVNENCSKCYRDTLFVRVIHRLKRYSQARHFNGLFFGRYGTGRRGR